MVIFGAFHLLFVKIFTLLRNFTVCFLLPRNWNIALHNTRALYDSLARFVPRVLHIPPIIRGRNLPIFPILFFIRNANYRRGYACSKRLFPSRSPVIWNWRRLLIFSLFLCEYTNKHSNCDGIVFHKTHPVANYKRTQKLKRPKQDVSCTLRCTWYK